MALLGIVRGQYQATKCRYLYNRFTILLSSLLTTYGNLWLFRKFIRALLGVVRDDEVSGPIFFNHKALIEEYQYIKTGKQIVW